jgi:hypothetical protein
MALQASGGNAMNYFTHMRLWINKINGAAGKIIKKDDSGTEVVVGGKSRMLVMKTRYGTPMLTTEFKIMFTEDDEANMIDEFIYRAKAARPDGFIKEVRKELIYVNTDTGETIKSKNSIEFVKMLMDVPAPEKRTKGDNSTSAFQYICGRLKIVGKPLDDLVALANSDSATANTDDETDLENDETDSIDFDEASKLMFGE